MYLFCQLKSKLFQQKWLCLAADSVFFYTWLVYWVVVAMATSPQSSVHLAFAAAVVYSTIIWMKIARLHYLPICLMSQSSVLFSLDSVVLKLSPVFFAIGKLSELHAALWETVFVEAHFWLLCSEPLAAFELKQETTFFGFSIMLGFMDSM